MSFTANTTNAQHLRRLADLFNTTSIGELATYRAMTQHLGFDIHTRRWLTIAAKRIANEETGAIFATERNVGYRRLPGAQAHALGRQARHRIRRVSNVTVKFITRALVLTNDMPDEDRRTILTELAALNLLKHLTMDRHLPRDPGVAPMPTVDAVRRSIEVLRERHRDPPSAPPP
jgi:hypothetical protein